MGLIPQVKCGRCDRTYSGLRSRCPYCGAHRHKKGKRTTDGDNATWKLIIGILLIVVLIAAVVVILVTSANEKNNAGNDGEDKNQVGSNSDEGTEGTGGKNDGKDDENDGNDVDPNGDQNGDANGDGNGDQNVDPNGGENNGQPGGNTDANTPPVNVIAASITVKTNYGSTASDHSIGIGETFQCIATITPSNATSIPVWSSDSSCVSVIPTGEDGLKVTITGMSKGVANITATVDSLNYTFIVRVS